MENTDRKLSTGIWIVLMFGFPVAFTLLGTSLVFGLIGFGWSFFDLLPLPCKPCNTAYLCTQGGELKNRYMKMSSGRKAETVTLGRSTRLLTFRSTATLQMT